MWNSSEGLELCGSCMEKYKKPTPWTLYLREGLIFFLGSLNAAAGLPPSSAKSPASAGLDVKSENNELQQPVPPAASAPLPSPSKSGSPAQGLERQNSPTGQQQRLLETCTFERVPPPARPRPSSLHSVSSEPVNGTPTTEPVVLLKANSDPVIFTSCAAEQALFSASSSDPVLFNSNAEPVQFTTVKSEPGLFALNRDSVYFPSNSNPLRFTSDPDTALFTPNVVEQGQFSAHEADPTLLTSNSEPVLFTSNAEPVHFISHSKPAPFTPPSEPVLFTPYPDPETYSEPLGHIPKSEPLRFTSSSESIPSFSSNLDSLPKALQVVSHHEPMLFPSSHSGPLPISTTPNFEPSPSNADVPRPTPTPTPPPPPPPSESLVRTQSKSGKKVSDGTLVDRMRTIVQQDCRLGKDLFTTGIELAERYNSCYKHETIHVRRVFEAMKTLGYTASKDTMQVQVQKVRRKVKLIYGLAMK